MAKNSSLVASCNLTFPTNLILFFLISSTFALLAAVLSWHFFEKQINSLKRKFSY